MIVTLSSVRYYQEGFPTLTAELVKSEDRWHLFLKDRTQITTTGEAHSQEAVIKLLEKIKNGHEKLDLPETVDEQQIRAAIQSWHTYLESI